MRSSSRRSEPSKGWPAAWSGATMCRTAVTLVRTDRPDLSAAGNYTRQCDSALNWADPRAFSLTSRITQRDTGTACGRSGQPRPPTSRRTEPQQAGSAVTFPGPSRLTGPARWMIQGRRPQTFVGSCQVRELTRRQAKDVDGIGRPAGVPAVRLLRCDPPSAKASTAGLPGAARMLAAAASARAGSRPVMPTRAPSAASPMAVALPMPPVPPVTRTDFPAMRGA
jgi:hypothetical protein